MNQLQNWCDNNPSADKESIISHWLHGCLTPDRSDEERFYAAVGRHGEFTTPETMLWLSAIWQAILDLNNPQGKEKEMIRFDALSWVLDTSEEPGSFHFACSVLGIVNVAEARKMIARGRKIKVPKIKKCVDCGVFIRQNLKRCSECTTLIYGVPRTDWNTLKARQFAKETPEQRERRIKRQREYGRKWRAAKKEEAA